MSITHRVVALAALLLSSSSVLRAADQLVFSNELLIAIDAPAAALDAPQPESAFGPRIEPLFETHSPGEAANEESLAPASSRRTWVLAAPAGVESVAPSTMSPWDIAHRVLHGKGPAEYNAIVDELRARHLPIEEIEPSVAQRNARLAAANARAKAPVCATPENPNVVVLCGGPSFYWPTLRRLAWHHEQDFTQLGPAQREAAPKFPPAGSPRLVTIAHLDTGYDPALDLSTPARLDFAHSHTYLAEDTGDCGQPSVERPGCDRFNGLNPTHGPSTLSILAGNKVDFRQDGYPPANDYLGGAPLARVMASRVSNSVILVYPKHVARAIHDMAGNADVISMSMGGAPSGALRDAVNDAYESGTAMFFAAGNFVRLPVPIFDVSSPHTIVYPARFSRTTPVAGITSAARSYGLGPSWLALLRHRFASPFSWMMRGSYGPASHMHDALAAYSPNISAHYATKSGVKNNVDMSFAGTSAATPQAAAAAALWLQVHRDDFSDDDWRSWRKTEAVYDVLLASARHDFKGFDTELFGAGVLQAHDALALKVPSELKPRPPARIGFDWITILAAIIGPDPEDDKDLDPEKVRLHTNMLKTEVAQLVASSAALQEIMKDVDPEAEAPPNGATLQRLRRELLRHPQASAYLKRALTAKR